MTAAKQELTDNQKFGELAHVRGRVRGALQGWGPPLAHRVLKIFRRVKAVLILSMIN